MDSPKSEFGSNDTAVDLITNHLDIWTSAIQSKSASGRGNSKNIELYGIKKLRQLILELAVRGKLVPQDPNDESASVLLERLTAEKTRRIKEKLLKKQRALPALSEGILHNLPNGWCACHLGDAYDVRDGTHDSPRATSTGYPLVTSKNLSSGKLDLTDVNYISVEDHLKIQERSAVDRDDILFAMIGSIGNPVLVDIDLDFSIKNVALFKYFDKMSSNPKYLKLFLEHAADVLRAEASGAVQSFVSLGKLRAFELALPPLAEQQRIVAKVDELMAVCDQLEQQTEDSIEAHATLVETLLATLTDSSDAAELEQNWSRIAEHFDTLFITEHSIDQLKQTVLQLAVMGKLVPQDPNDESASILLERIAAEKNRLVKEKKIKKQQPLPPISEDEKPFALPEGWWWCRLGSLGIGSTGKTPSTKHPDYYEGNIPFIGPGQITTEGELLEADKFLSEEGLLNSTEANSGDVLMVCIGGSIGKSVIASGRVGFNQQINTITPLYVNSRYLLSAISTDTFYEELLAKATGSATPIINRGKWESLRVPLPPESEQHRIVAKVDQLITLCDQLKERLQHAQQTQLHLADASVEKALNA
jgi:type I restriction enzyme S subunit